MERCFICFDYLSESIYLPMDEEYVGQDISIFKNTFIIRKIEPFEFCYYYVCSKCLDRYLEYYGRFFQYIRDRELGYHKNIKKKNKKK